MGVKVFGLLIDIIMMVFHSCHSVVKNSIVVLYVLLCLIINMFIGVISYSWLLSEKLLDVDNKGSYLGGKTVVKNGELKTYRTRALFYPNTPNIYQYSIFDIHLPVSTPSNTAKAQSTGIGKVHTNRHQFTTVNPPVKCPSIQLPSDPPQ